MAGIILRKLNPQLSPDKLLFALCREFATYYDNTDKKYTTADVIHIVERVLSADINRELGRWKRKNYIVNVSYCKKHGVSKRSVVGEQNGIRQAAERDKRYEQIARYYDPTETDNKNLLRLKQKGIKCSKNTLTAFKLLYGYTQGREQANPQGSTQAQGRDSTQQQHPMMPDIAESVKKMLRGGLNN